MNKVHIFLTVAVMIAAMGCGGRRSSSGAGSETAVMPQTIELENLQLRDDAYYFNDALYSGTAIMQGTPNLETWEMKDGKFHGEYTERFADYVVTGNYIDGKKDGEWRIADESHIEIQNYRNGMKHGEWRFFHHQPWAAEGEPAEILYKTETYENDVLINEWILANDIPSITEEMIIATIKAFQNKDEAAINQLIHPDFGLILLTRPGAYEVVSIRAEIAFSDPPSGYAIFELSIPAIDNYSVKFEELPVFDCDDEWKWNKPAGIYSQAVKNRMSPIGVARGMIAAELFGSDNDMEIFKNDVIKKLEYFENNTSHHYSTIVVGEIEDYYNFLDFTFTFVDGKWYLTVINMTAACA